VSSFLEFVEAFMRERVGRAAREDPHPSVWCWKCGGVRAAEHGFMRLMCLTCGTSHEMSARWRDE
jgi:hypothetical protein